MRHEERVDGEGVPVPAFYRSCALLAVGPLYVLQSVDGQALDADVKRGIKDRNIHLRGEGDSAARIVTAAPPTTNSSATRLSAPSRRMSAACAARQAPDAPAPAAPRVAGRRVADAVRAPQGPDPH
mmetsp:Transcript_3827/g.11035  ORF Transcript_3827/g.11035 Transcript_3827/m.11035 type:complete len:126 (+) Transcript_3827:1076-1453(+)